MPMMPMEPAKEVRMVLAFFVLRLLKLKERAVRKDMEAFPMVLWAGAGEEASPGSRGLLSETILPSFELTILLA